MHFFLRVSFILTLIVTTLSLTAAPIRTVRAQAAIACEDTDGLIAAIDTGVSVINLAAGCTYILDSGHTDTSDGATDAGLPDITTTITINGNGATIQRESFPFTPEFGIVYVAATGNLTLNNVTISGGLPSIADNNGGGIYNNGGIVTLRGSTISNNIGDDGGGILNNEGMLTVINSIFSGNFAGITGGGIFNNGGAVTIMGSTFSGNSAAMGGGIATISGMVTITGSTFSGNLSGVGGGIGNFEGVLALTNSTLTGNMSEDVGGGIFSSPGSTTTMSGSTLSGNSAMMAGGGILSMGIGELTVNNSRISGNSAPAGGGIFIGGEFELPEEPEDPEDPEDPEEPEDPQDPEDPEYPEDPEEPEEEIVSALAHNRNARLSIQQLTDTITGSCIFNNITTAADEYDVIMDGDGSVLNAANNFWGDASGPGGIASGLGDTVSEDVIYTPFLTAPAASCATSATSAAPAASSGPSTADHARAQAPLCADLSGTTSPVVRVDVSGGTVPNGGVFCRIINENGSYRPASSAAQIGSSAVINRGVLQAVDVFGQAGGTSVPRFSYPVRVCLLGSGSFLFLDALTQPRALSELPASLENGYTCATIPNAGTVVLVGGAPTFTAPPAGTALTGCMVTTNYLLNLRATPSDSAAIITQVPYNVTLTATEHQGGWFHVDYLGKSGWLNTAYLNPSAGCG